MKNRKLFIGVCSLVVVAILLFVIYTVVSPKGTDGKKTITVSVKHADGIEKEFTYTTDEKYLGPVLREYKLVEGYNGDYGLYITKVDGEEAKESLKQWWCITKSQQQVNTAVDQTPIHDGDHFEITLSTY